jgi:simple sugar transport system permease protein
MNLSLEGTMLMGGVTAFAVADITGSVWLALFSAMLAGAAMAAVYAFLAVGLRVSQIISGLGLLIVGSGLSSFIGLVGENPFARRPPTVSIEPFFTSGLADIPVLGPVLFAHDYVVYGGWIVAVAAYVLLYRTDWGLRIRSVGTDPASSEASGVSVSWVRSLSVLAGGALAGIGGGYLSIGLVRGWQDGMTAGAGWLAIAIVFAVRWRPLLLFGAAFIFGASIRLGFTLQVLGTNVSPELLSMIPYILAIIAVLYAAAGSSRNVTEPKALAEPFFREDR